MVSESYLQTNSCRAEKTVSPTVVLSADLQGRLKFKNRETGLKGRQGKTWMRDPSISMRLSSVMQTDFVSVSTYI